MQRSLIQEFMLYEFQQGHSTTEATQNIYSLKGEKSVPNTVSRWLKKFHAGCKKLDDPSKLGRLKNVYSKAALQAIVANPKSSNRRVSGELCLLQSRVVHHRHGLGKIIHICRIMSHVIKVLHIFQLPLTNSKHFYLLLTSHIRELSGRPRL